MDALVYARQGRRRAETMSANECRARLDAAGVVYADDATLAELRRAVEELEGA
ncbi:MAG: hypothetical protein MR209_00075 [Veillonellaceae bacterium]|nr:hypothetical protein [Veillonellaceae bacterium]